MAKAMSSGIVWFLVIFLVVMGSATLAAMASVKIYNELMTGAPVRVHCRSLRTGQEVVPETALGNGEKVEWSFKPSVLGITQFYCDFKWRAVEYQSFNVWVDGPILDFFHVLRPCTFCVWIVTTGGFDEYEANNMLGSPVAQHPWKVATV